MDKVLCVLLAMVLFCSCSKEDEDIQYEGYAVINKATKVPIVELKGPISGILLYLKNGDIIEIHPGETEDIGTSISAKYKPTLVHMTYSSGGMESAQRGTMSVEYVDGKYKIKGSVELKNLDTVDVRYGID